MRENKVKGEKIQKDKFRKLYTNMLKDIDSIIDGNMEYKEITFKLCSYIYSVNYYVPLRCDMIDGQLYSLSTIVETGH